MRYLLILRQNIYCLSQCLRLSLTMRGESLAVEAGHAGQHGGVARQGGGDAASVVPERRTDRGLKQDQVTSDFRVKLYLKLCLLFRFEWLDMLDLEV